MRIGIDGTTWHNNRGFGRFTRELLGALFADPGPHRYVLLTDSPPAELTSTRDGASGGSRSMKGCFQRTSARANQRLKEPARS